MQKELKQRRADAACSQWMRHGAVFEWMKPRHQINCRRRPASHNKGASFNAACVVCTVGGPVNLPEMQI